MSERDRVNRSATPVLLLPARQDAWRRAVLRRPRRTPPWVHPAAADAGPVNQRTLAGHHRPGGPVVPVLCRKSAVCQPLALHQVKRLGAALVVQPVRPRQDHEAEQDVVMPAARKVQITEPRVDDATVPESAEGPVAEEELSRPGRRLGGVPV